MDILALLTFAIKALERLVLPAPEGAEMIKSLPVTEYIRNELRKGLKVHAYSTRKLNPEESIKH